MWLLFAVLSAVFAALTSILAKVGIEGVPSNLATLIRTLVVVGMAWVMVLLTGETGAAAGITRKSWIFLILSGLATGASWLCYIDKLSIVLTLILAFVFLHEDFTWKAALGSALITAGTLVMVL